MNIHVIFAFCNGVQYPDTDVLSSQILPFSSFREACIYNLRFKTFFQHEFVNHNFLVCHDNFCGRGVKHIVLHAKISSYFSYGRVYTDKIAILTGL
jgi:hypothetical protein